jgi:hypothetical protein
MAEDMDMQESSFKCSECYFPCKLEFEAKSDEPTLCPYGASKVKWVLIEKGA